MDKLFDVVNSYVPNDVDSNAVWIVRFTSAQFALSFFTTLLRPDANAALALLGLFGSFYLKRDPIRLYFLFLCMSTCVDFIWMMQYGGRISGLELSQQNRNYYDATPTYEPNAGTAKFVMAMSVVQFLVKLVSIPFCHKLFKYMPEEDSLDRAAGLSGPSVGIAYTASGVAYQHGSSYQGSSD